MNSVEETTVVAAWLNGLYEGPPKRSNYDLGRMLGVSEAQVRQWRGNAGVSDRYIPNIAQAMGISQNALREQLGRPPVAHDEPLYTRGEMLPRVDVAPSGDDADGVLLDLPDEALRGLSEVERAEVIAAATQAALKAAREIRGQG